MYKDILTDNTSKFYQLFVSLAMHILVCATILLSFGIGSAFHVGNRASSKNNLQQIYPLKRGISHIFKSNDAFSYQTPLFLSNAAVEDSSSEIKLASIDDGNSIKEAANFMVDAFWLQSPQQLVTSSSSDNTSSSISDKIKQNLANLQAQDLNDKYGERMGKRLLQSSLLTVRGGNDNDDILGIIGIEVCLLNKETKKILSPEISEDKLKQAVAGPKQRRQYKNSPASELALELLPPELILVCCLSNLSVSSKARRKGVAIKLCEKAEDIAKNEFGFTSLYLKVETENVAARGLYEDKLGYIEQYSDSDALGLRVDIESGTFVEQPAETLIMEKIL